MAHRLYGGFVLGSTERIAHSVVFTAVMAVTILMRRLGVTRRWARVVFVALTALPDSGIGGR